MEALWLFLFPAAWNANVMTGTPAAIMKAPHRWKARAEDDGTEACKELGSSQVRSGLPYSGCIGGS